MFDDKLSINLGIGSMLVHLNNINYIRVIQGEEICIIMGVNLNSLSKYSCVTILTSPPTAVTNCAPFAITLISELLRAVSWYTILPLM